MTIKSKIFPILSSCLLFISLSALLSSCNRPNNISQESNSDKINSNEEVIVTEKTIPIKKNGDIFAIIEIPAGSVEKWEMNKENGNITRDSINGKPRLINYLGYPANYGMIPNTMLTKERGGDGDPLDVIVIGKPLVRGTRVKCKIIGVLYLLDNGEQDDKLIAISVDSPLHKVNDINQLDHEFQGALDIIELWFSNYKGPGKMISNGYGRRANAIAILDSAIEQYNSIKEIGS